MLASSTAKLQVSIIIKALNEERHIRSAIGSALAAVAEVGGEVILADSASTDHTVEIARQFPITVVQIRNPMERRCGVGPQLGYQVARGDFIYILDGDMEIDREFLPAALAEMAKNPKLGGVAGIVAEQSEASYQFRGRKRRAVGATPGDCAWLDMGGLYRATALREVGYFSDRNLHAYEEMDLGLRLADAGWSLCRLPVRGVVHHGRDESNLALLAKRWKSGYLDGAGEVLRAAVGRRYFFRVARTQWHLFVGLAIWLGLLGGMAALPFTGLPLTVTLMAVLALIVFRTWRIGSLADALFGQVVWQVTSLAMVRGFLTSPRDPQKPIDHVVLSSPASAARRVLQ